MADKLILDRQDMKNRATAHLRIYVGGVPDNVTIDDLYDHFAPYGKIDGIIVNRNFGFVQYDNEDSAQAAISQADGSVFQGKTVCVRTAQTNPDKRHEPVVNTVQSEASSGHGNTANDDGEEQYDNHGNYIGEKQTYQGEEDYTEEGWNEGGVDARGRGRGRGMRGMRSRGRGHRGGLGFRDRSPVAGRGDWPERGFDRYSQPPPEYPRPVPVTERNDCEIIVVSKTLTEYAEYIEGRLKRLGIVVDLLYPMEDVPIGKVLGNIASRGCLYAILVMPQNQELNSLTLTILHGLPQEHRNMPLEDALSLLSRNFQEVRRGGAAGREAVYALLGQLADGRTLTALQYDKVIEYLQERRDQQVKIEVGGPITPANTKTQVDLQQRILSILNDKNVTEPTPATPSADSKSKLINDPTVRKALDSILQKFA